VVWNSLGSPTRLFVKAMDEADSKVYISELREGNGGLQPAVDSLAVGEPTHVGGEEGCRRQVWIQHRLWSRWRGSLSRGGREGREAGGSLAAVEPVSEEERGGSLRESACGVDPASEGEREREAEGVLQGVQ